MNTGVVVMLMNYFHDLASGLFFGSVVAYFLARRVIDAGAGANAARLTLDLYQRFRPVILVSLALVILGGFPRAYFYDEYEWLPAAGRSQVPALIAKHVVLVGITVLSLVFFFKKRPKLEALSK